MKNVLIIEDELGVQITLEDRLSAEGYNVTIKGDGIEGEDEALNNDYDILLLDIMLPNRDGFAICDNLRKAGIDIPILMLTARNTDLDTVMGFRQGADDYLAKPFNMAVLLARMEALLRRSAHNQTSTARDTSTMVFGEFVLDRESGQLKRKDLPIALNPLEYRLINYLATHPEIIISRDTLLDNVWGYNTDSTSRTVDVPLAKLRHKKGEAQVPKHIQTVWGRGYRFEMDPV
ncbi:MAG: response regulator transcription factor [Spirochaetaceae bacterium]|nr:response regulator transcription factor [Spirochaetaceae bacterium]